MLLTSSNGYARGYWYSEGYVRTASQYWQLGELGNSYVHLTNDAVQKMGEDYGRY